MTAELIPLVFTGGWASGINPYLVVLLTGLAGRFTDVAVPEALTRNDVLIAAAVLTAIDFVVDKTAYLDSTWDAINTAIRPVAGAALALLISSVASSAAVVAVYVLEVRDRNVQSMLPIGVAAPTATSGGSVAE